MSSYTPKKFEFFAKDNDGWMDIIELEDGLIKHIRVSSDLTLKNWTKEVTETPVEEKDWELFFKHVEALQLESWRSKYDVAEFDEVDADGSVYSLFVSHGFKWQFQMESDVQKVSSKGVFAYPSHDDASVSDVDSDGRFGDLCEVIEEMLHYRFCHVDRIDRDHAEKFGADAEF